MKKNTYFKNLVDTLLSIKDGEEMSDFLSVILTPHEISAIPLRLQIIELLKKGVSQREIAKKLHVGVATVTRGSREMRWRDFKRWR